MKDILYKETLMLNFYAGSFTANLFYFVLGKIKTCFNVQLHVQLDHNNHRILFNTIKFHIIPERRTWYNTT